MRRMTFGKICGRLLLEENRLKVRSPYRGRQKRKENYSFSLRRLEIENIKNRLDKDHYLWYNITK
jgi:hypothetical protein